jgi:hypothetical protein
MKKCSKCKIEKEYSAFNKNKSRKDGFQSSCKKCHSKMMQDYKIKGLKKQSDRKVNLKRRYGIAQSEYDKMYNFQKGKCALCDAETIGRKGAVNFCVDHNHKTGDVRGLLCHNCNVVLGKIKDNREWLSRALKYI